MLYLKEEGIIITKRPLREKDSTILILTKNYGLVRTVATGLRRQTSKLLGFSEPGTIGRFYLAVSASKSIISHNFVRLISILAYKLPGSGFKKHPYLFLWALRFLSSVSLLQLSDELWEIINNLDKYILRQPRGFQVWFIFKVLNELGLQPNFDYCNHCGKSFISLTPPYHLIKNKVAAYIHKDSIYCLACRKPSFEPLTQKDLLVIKKITDSDFPIYPYPPALKSILKYVTEKLK